jgi:hypothetical protein
MTMSIAFFNCPHCVDSFAFDFQKLTSLTLHSRVRVRCPGCQNVVEVVTNAYSVIHNADPEQYQRGGNSGSPAARHQDQRRGDSPEYQAAL